ncbi:sensor histidine kinase [Blastococcus sp. SYSU DS0541]
MTATGARPGAAAGWTAAAAAAATAAVVALPSMSFAYQAPALRAVLETLNAVVALLTALLVYGRFRDGRRVQDLLIVLALCTVAMANLVLTALPGAVAPGEDHFARWEALAIRLLGTVVLTAAALVPVARHATRRMSLATTAGIAAVVVALTAAGVALGEALPPMVDPLTALADASRPRLVAHPAVLAVQGVGAGLYALAAVAFTRQSARTGDQMVRWIGAGCVLAAFARAHYLLFPSLYSDFVHTGDFLRLGFYLLLLVGAVGEIRSYWQLRVHTAVLEDRRRMARDLHDGLTQELTYISTQARRLATRPDRATAELIDAAAARAVDEARQAISALTASPGDPFSVALQRLADDMSHRYDVKVVTQLGSAADVDGTRAEALLRITAEAVRNAVRHGAAQRVELRMTSDPTCLAIIDDGRGFDPSTARPGGFGLTSMRQRAEALGAALRIDSAPGEGTTVRVSWP